MGKIRTRTIGNEEVENEQKEEQKKRSAEKKADKKKPAEEVETVKAESTEEKTPKKAKKAKVEEDSEKKTPKLVSKKHKAAVAKVDKSKQYGVEEAIELLKKIKYAKFDEAVEVHLNVDETGLKGEIELPFSSGKVTRVKVLDDKLLEQIEKGVIDFDVLVAHPSYMAKLAKFAKFLGPKGLMPNPKAGTVSTNPDEVVKKFSKGVLRWKTEPKFPLVHQMIGKISHDSSNLSENVKSFVRAVGKSHIKSAFVKSTMSPGLKIDLNQI